MQDNVQLAFDAIQLYQTQYSQVDTVWGYFSAVTLAISGFVLGMKRSTKTIKQTIAIVAAYLVFCVGNHKALKSGQELLLDLGKNADFYAEKAGLVVNDLHYLTWSSSTVGYFHRECNLNCVNACR
ncbi:hypothetical protein [Endozoicomonas atrinae]|uniref:hypothetical protein n=1 Tax=Endozoicomonas atrinae TaxID=1333660 RepID=UPI00111300A1|nr:hypothetical protein [Endozoicomonas atrinae]